MLCRSLLMIASSEESTIASYRSLDGMKSDLLLIVEKSSQNRNPRDFRPRTNGRIDGEFGILAYFGPRTRALSVRITSQSPSASETSSKPPLRSVSRTSPDTKWSQVSDLRLGMGQMAGLVFFTKRLM